MSRAAYKAAASAYRAARRARDAQRMTVEAAPRTSHAAELNALNALPRLVAPRGFDGPCTLDPLSIGRGERASLALALKNLRSCVTDDEAEGFAMRGERCPKWSRSKAERAVRIARRSAWARFGGAPDREPSLIEIAASFAAVPRPVCHSPAPRTGLGAGLFLSEIAA